MCVAILMFTISAAKSLAVAARHYFSLHLGKQINKQKTPQEQTQDNSLQQDLLHANVRARNYLFVGLSVILFSRLWINLFPAENQVRNAQKTGQLSHLLTSMCCIYACSGLEDAVPQKWLSIFFPDAQGYMRYTISNHLRMLLTKVTATPRPFPTTSAGS